MQIFDSKTEFCSIRWKRARDFALVADPDDIGFTMVHAGVVVVVFLKRLVKRVDCWVVPINGITGVNIFSGGIVWTTPVTLVLELELLSSGERTIPFMVGCR
jgi:hypothetical protein